MLAAQLQHRAIDQHHLDAKQVIGGDAIFQTVRAAGIHTDIAADGAGKLRAGVGCIKETLRACGIGDGEIGDARLYPRRAIVKIKLKDRTHFRQADHHGVFLRDSAAGKRGACPARHDRNAGAMAICHDSRRLLRRSRQSDGERQTAIGNESIGLERHEFAGLVHKTVIRQDGLEVGDNSFAIRQDLSARLQKLYRLRHRRSSVPITGIVSLPL